MYADAGESLHSFYGCAERESGRLSQLAPAVSWQEQEMGWRLDAAQDDALEVLKILQKMHARVISCVLIGGCATYPIVPQCVVRVVVCLWVWVNRQPAATCKGALAKRALVCFSLTISASSPTSTHPPKSTNPPPSLRRVLCIVT